MLPEGSSNGTLSLSSSSSSSSLSSLQNDDSDDVPFEEPSGSNADNDVDNDDVNFIFFNLISKIENKNKKKHFKIKIATKSEVYF